MTTLHDIFDYEAFLRQVDEGFIRVGSHPTADLSIANYTPLAQYNDVRTPEVESSRGLIFHTDTLEVVARGFKRFYNWDDSGQPYPPTGPMVLSTKFDGSLGILYRNPSDGSLAIATRGSFASDQAIHATKRLEEILYADSWDDHLFGTSLKQDILSLLSRGFTPLFEVIYPQNRIIIDYGGADRLVLLDVIDNKTGYSNLTEFDSLFWRDKAEKNLVKGGFSDSLTHTIPQGEEGFVLYWPGSGFRCKMKSAEYVELHRLVTGLSKRSVWEMKGQGMSTTEIAEQIPDELHDWLRATVIELNDQAAAILDQIHEDYTAVATSALTEDMTSGAGMFQRATFAKHAAAFPETRGYLFMVLDGKDEDALWKAVWKTIRPAGDTRVWNSLEDVA